MFFKKKEAIPLRSDEYEIIIKKISYLVGEIESLGLKIRNLDTELRTLRTKINYHINKEGYAEENGGQEESKNFLNPFG